MDPSVLHEKLISYVVSEDIEKCQQLLSSLEDKTKRKILMMTDQEGLTAVHHASSREFHRIITVLLDSAELNQTSHEIVSPGENDAILDLCNPTLLANLVDFCGRTPLHFAALTGSVDCGMVRLNYPLYYLISV